MTDRETPQTPRPRDEVTFTDIARLGWRRLKEMKTVFYLLIVLSAGSLVATVLPQQQDPEYYLERYGQFLSNIILRLGLDHVSTATWFLLLMALLMLSLVACTRNLWSIAQSRWRIPGPEAIQGAAGRGQTQRPISVPVSAEVAAGVVQDAGRRLGYRAWDAGEAHGARCLYLCRHRWSAWGTTLAHYAVFLIGLGALMGALPSLSVDEYLEIPEGHTSLAEEVPAMPFQLRLNDFRIETSPNTGAIINYFSDLSVIEGEQEVRRETISVNRPLRYKGFYISQSSWSLGEARVRVKSGARENELAFPLARAAEMDPHASAWGVPEDGAVAFLASGDAAVLAQAFYIDARREEGEVVGRNSETLGTPAISLVVVSGLPVRERGASKDSEKGALLPGPRPVSFRWASYGPQLAQMVPPAAGDMPQHNLTEVGFLLEGETKHTPAGDVTFLGVTESSGLGIRKDPGVPLVWVGFVGCLTGMALIFYFPLRQAYVRLTPREGREGECRLQLQVRGGLLSNPDQDAQKLIADIETAAAARQPRGNAP